jgi:hypothetical protein
MLLHPGYAEVSDIGANALFPVKLRLRPALTLFTRRFEAQLHWQPVAKRRLLRGDWQQLETVTRRK